MPGKIVVAWPSTVGTIPLGWSRIADLDDKYPRAAPADTEGGSTGGATTHKHVMSSGHKHYMGHSHTIPGSGAASGTVANDSGGTFAADAHTHTSADASASIDYCTALGAGIETGTASNDLNHVTVIFIGQSNPSTIPVGCWAWCPDDINVLEGWSGSGLILSLLSDHMLKGAALGANGGTITSDVQYHVHSANHDHGSASHTHPTRASNAPAEAASGAAVSGAARVPCSNTHTHSLSFGAATANVGTSTGCDTSSSLKDVLSYQLKLMEATSEVAIPTGIIAIWTGLISEIPDGWKLCDGANSTPDLRNRFLRRVYDAPGASGTGSHTHGYVNSHTHPVSSHAHGMTMGAAGAGSGTGGSTNIAAASHTHSTWSNSASTNAATGVTNYADVITTLDTVSSDPPYYTVQYVMKVEASSSIKTVEGLAKASVKTIEGLAIASVKTLEGLA